MNARQEIGWFRTPIAAAMLSGVLAGAISIVVTRFVEYLISQQVYSWFLTAEIVGAYFRYVAMLTVPAICQRRMKLIVSAAQWAILITLIFGLLYFVFATFLVQLLWTKNGFSPLFAIWAVVSSAIVSLFYSHSLARVFALRPTPKSVYGMGLLAAVIWQLTWMTLYFLSISPGKNNVLAMNTEETRVINVMMWLVGSVVCVVLPTIAIEKELKKRSAAASIPKSETASEVRANEQY